MTGRQWTEEDIEENIREKAARYTPEWKFAREGPDVGSVIALLFAEQMAKIMQACKRRQRQYKEALCALTGAMASPPRAAESVIVMNADDGAGEGVFLKKGTRFLADLEEREAPLFYETAHALYVSHEKPTEILGISGERCEVTRADGFPQRMFQVKGEGLYQEELVFQNPFAANVPLTGMQAELSAEEGSYCFFARKEEDGAFTDIPLRARKKGGALVFEEEAPVGSWSSLVIRRRHPQKKEVKISGLFLEPGEKEETPACLYDGMNRISEKEGRIFGEEPGAWQECYIVSDEIFCAAGARIQIRFGLSFARKRTDETDGGSDEDKGKPPLIKRAEKSIRPVDVYVDEVRLSYYNGRGFREIQTSQSVQKMFGREGRAGECTITFPCPEDIAPLEIDGKEAYAVRLQVKKADGCYTRPACFHYPEAKDFRLLASYPKAAAACRGASVFPPFPYAGESMLVGFSGKWKKGPVSLFFLLDMEKGKRPGRTQARPFSFLYSSKQGFLPLAVTDYTDGFTHSGMILFYPPEDVEAVRIEGVTACWICIRSIGKKPLYCPKIKEIRANGAVVRNLWKSVEERYYIDEITQNYKISLCAEQIVGAEVWVNEAGQISDGELHRLQKEFPEIVRVEQNGEGEAAGIFVRWEEKDSLDASRPLDRHYVLDREKRQIMFGDGRRGRAPMNTAQTAVKISLFCCDGDAGNVERGSIREAASNRIRVAQIENLLPAAGGCGTGGREEKLRRGESILAYRDTPVTIRDYRQAALSFSEEIADVACACEGRDLLLVVLVKDFWQETGSFARVKEELERRFAKHVGGHIKEIYIREPDFVDAQVDIWITADSAEDAVGAQKILKEEAFSYVGQSRRSGRLPRWEELHGALVSRLAQMQTEGTVKLLYGSLSFSGLPGDDDKSADRNMDFCVCKGAAAAIHIKDSRRTYEAFL